MSLTDAAAVRRRPISCVSCCATAQTRPPWSVSTNGWRPWASCSACVRSPGPPGRRIPFVADPCDIHRSALLCHPARTGGATCRPYVHGHQGVRPPPCSEAPLNTSGSFGSDPIAIEVPRGGEPGLRESSDPRRSTQPNLPVCPPSPKLHSYHRGCLYNDAYFSSR